MRLPGRGRESDELDVSCRVCTQLSLPSHPFTVNGNIFKSKRQVRNVAMVFLYSGQDISFVRQHSPL